jgi:hypothetical protein
MISDNHIKLNIVAVHARSLQGPFLKQPPFVLCAIRVDHNVARWGTIFPPKSSIPFPVLTVQDEPIRNVGSLGVIKAFLRGAS